MTKEQRNKTLKIWREKNRQKLRNQHRLWYEKNKHREDLQKQRKIWWKNWYENNKDKNLERGKLWKKNNIEKVRQSKKQWNKNNKEKYSLMRKRELNNVNVRIALNIRNRLRIAILSQNTWKKGKTIELLGCSIKELKIYLEKQFTEGMSWNNYGEWHIDHIKPLSRFNLSLLEEQKIACNFTNLQPLWAIDNNKKGNKYDEEVYNFKGYSFA